MGRLYDEAIQLQSDMNRISKGLTFWSFNVMLNDLIKECGIPWISLMKRMVEANTITEPDAVGQVSKRFATSRINALQAKHMTLKAPPKDLLNKQADSLTGSSAVCNDGYAIHKDRKVTKRATLAAAMQAVQARMDRMASIRRRVQLVSEGAAADEVLGP